MISRILFDPINASLENENEEEPRVGLKLNSVSTCISKEREIHCNRGK